MKRNLGAKGTMGSYGEGALAALLLGAMAYGAPGVSAGAAETAPSVAQRVSIGRPLNFEQNLGQAPSAVQYLAHGAAYAIALTEQGAALAFGPQTSNATKTIRLRVQGADRNSIPTAEESLPGRVNYYIGNDPSQWRTNVATFAKVRYPNVYPGIDLLYYGTEGKLEYDFVVAPGSNAKAIGMKFEGAQRLRLDAHGDLKIRTPDREIAFQRPVAYQWSDAGQRMPVSARYRVNETAVSFEVGAYDHSKQLIIDPVLDYFSYLGGSGYDGAGIATPTGSPFNTSGQAAAVDSAGDLYVTGYTESADFPVKDAYETAPTKVQGGTPSSAFVTKFAPDGKSVIFSTYLGGTVSSDQATSIAVDASGNAIVVGTTGSSDFPVTAGAYQTVCNPSFPNGVATPNCNGSAGLVAFVSKFSPTGTLLHSTFLSGSNTDTTAYAVAVDSSGRAYVAGETLPGSVVPAGSGGTPQSIPFPTTSGAVLTTPPYSTGVGGYQNVLSQQEDAFISVFDPTLSTLLYSSLFGEPQVSNAGAGFEGASFTVGQAVTVDASGNFYLAGTSEDASLETTAGAYEANASSCGTVSNNTLLNCAFVAKFSPVGNGTPSLIYGTYLGHTVGGAYGDLMTGIAADAAGDAYISGYTNQATFPTSAGAYQTTCNQYGVNGNTDAECGSAFVAKLNPGGTALLAGTYFGGYYGGANGIADSVTSMGPIVLDAAGNVYIGGVAANNLPQVNPLGTNDGVGGATSPFVAELDSSLKTLLFSSLFSTGGQSGTVVDGLALDSAGDVYVAGTVGSPPSSAATPGAFQSTYGGGTSDAFVAKITITAPVATTTALSVSPTTASTGAAISFSAKVTPNSGTGTPTGSVRFLSGTTTLGGGTLNAQGVAQFMTSTLPAGVYQVTAAYGGDANDAVSTSSAVTLTVSAPPAPTVAISASPSTITLGQSTTLTWSSTNATACTASNGWTGALSTSGTMSETPTATGSVTYVLNCSGAGGSAGHSVTVTVNAPAPTVTISASPSSITLGQSSTLTWSSTNATSCQGSGAWTTVEPTTGTLSVTPSAVGSATYTLTCQGAGGSIAGSATVTVAAAPSKTGGGGSFDLFALLLLVATGVLRRMRVLTL